MQINVNQNVFVIWIFVGIMTVENHLRKTEILFRYVLAGYRDQNSEEELRLSHSGY